MTIALSSIPVFTAEVAHARTVDFAAYTLWPGGVREALIAAAHAGARIRVRLERDPLDDAAGSLHAANNEAIALLSAAGADAALTAPGSSMLHLKAAVVDGVAWLDDRNWAGGAHETVIRDADRDDVNALSAALDGTGSTGGRLRTTKSGALSLEVDLIRTAGAAGLAVESESFGSGTVYNALLARARVGLPTRLLVAGRELGRAGTAAEIERRRLGRLQSLGVEVRAGDPRADLDEKLAVSGDAAWVGSANATSSYGPASRQCDWGMATRESVLLDALHSAFERNWRASIPLAASAGGALRDPNEAILP